MPSPAKKKPTARNVVTQHNRLIGSRHTLTISEQKLFLAVVAQIKQEDIDFEIYQIDIKDFVELTGTRHKGMYSKAQEITENLLGKVLKIALPGGDLLQTNFLGHAEYKKGAGHVKVSVHPKLKALLLELKKNFTSYDIRNILPLQSKYALRIYELLKQFRITSERIFFVDELRTILEVPESYSYSRFKHAILVAAQKELYEHTDLYFTFEEIKQRRKVTSLRFVTHKRKVDLSTRPSPKLEILDAEIDTGMEEKKQTENPNPLYDVLRIGVTATLGEPTYKMWFEDCEIQLKGDTIEIYLPTAFKASWVKNHHADDLKKIFPNTPIEILVNKKPDAQGV